MLQYWLRQFRDQEHEMRMQKKGARLVVEDALRNYVALGTCFSEESDLLSQWRGYAQDGSGFSVTFERNKLEDLVSNFQGEAHPKLSKISYGGQDWGEINQVMKELHGAFGSDAENYHEEDGIGEMAIGYTPEKHKRQRKAAQNLYTVKNGAFREEKEWRLFLFDSMRKIDNVEFRESSNGLSPFVRLKFSPDAISGITLGPTNRTPLSMIEAALEKYGIESWVHSSNASYRNN